MKKPVPNGKLALIKERIALPTSYSVTAAAEEFRNEIVLKARDVTAIDSALANTEAGEVCRDIRRHLKAVEDMRKELTLPLLDCQRLLKSLADDHILPLKDELARIELLATGWQLAENKRVEDARRAQEAEIARLEQERLAALAKLAQEAAAVAPAGQPDDEEAWHREQEAKKALDAVAAAKLAVQVAPPPVAQKARGQQMRQVLRYEVLDIAAVYAARPELCEVSIKPAAVLATCDPRFPVPGLKLWHEDKAIFTTR